MKMKTITTKEGGEENQNAKATENTQCQIYDTVSFP